MTNEQFIEKHKESDIRSLALKKVPEGVDALWCLRQIEGYQLAKKKLPRWASMQGLWYPSRLSMEQCSSEQTAKYKADIISRLLPEGKHSMIDLTGGFGVDFSYMAKGFQKAYYVERQEVLCEAARHNMPILGLPNAYIINKECMEVLSQKDMYDVIFLDPARRDDAGKKTVAIEDCTPDITTIQDTLLLHSRYVMVKLSPMLDISQALRSLRNVIEVHVISVKGECKELLLLLSQKEITNTVTTHCVNLSTEDLPFICKGNDREITYTEPSVGQQFFEPNASIMKAGVQNVFAREYGLQKLHPQSNLFVGNSPKEGNAIPARRFTILGIYDFSKTSIKELQKQVSKANITIRNFPSSVIELRKRLKIKDGGEDYLFVTTLKDERHAILLCRK